MCCTTVASGSGGDSQTLQPTVRPTVRPTFRLTIRPRCWQTRRHEQVSEAAVRADAGEHAGSFAAPAGGAGGMLLLCVDNYDAWWYAVKVRCTACAPRGTPWPQSPPRRPRR